MAVKIEGEEALRDMLVKCAMTTLSSKLVRLSSSFFFYISSSEANLTASWFFLCFFFLFFSSVGM